MAIEPGKLLVNFDDAATRAAWANSMRTMKGKWNVEFTEFNPKRVSDAQRRYFFGVVVPHFRGYMNETQGRTYTADAMYRMLCMALDLFVEHVNPITGEVAKDYTIRHLGKREMCEAIDAAIKLAWDKFELCIPAPDEYYEKPSRPVSVAAIAENEGE